MVTPVHSNHRISKSKVARLRVPLNLEQQGEARLRLSYALQATLDLSEMLNLFFEQAQSLLQVGGLVYRNYAQPVELKLGNDYAHHCDYRLNTQKDNLGDIIFARSKRFDEKEMMQLEQMLGALVLPLRNALCYREALNSAMRDTLTDTGNRAALDGALEHEIKMAQRYDHDLSMLVIDIDHFKRVNDKHGHSKGDEVLREVAQAIKTISRQTDMTFRYGGEEFVVLLSKTNTLGAEIIAERTREFISDIHVSDSHGDINPTVSIGVSTLTKEDDTESLFVRADKALYYAKQNGRNRVVTSEEFEASEQLIQA